jgi:hypothetical protein
MTQEQEDIICDQALLEVELIAIHKSIERVIELRDELQ